MSVQKLKMAVLKGVIQTEDECILSQLQNILSHNPNANFGNDFSSEQLASIGRGKKHLKEGRGIPMEEFVAKLQNGKNTWK